MTYFRDSFTTLYHGDARNMAELEDESVQMCVSSPPYWGLRKYAGLPDSIWGNVDHCQHEWELERTARANAGGGEQSPKVHVKHLRNFQVLASNEDRASYANTCSLCGAWRGQYGLEPTVDMYVQHTVEILREVRRVLRKDGVCFWNVGDSYSGGGRGSGYGGKQDTNRGTLDMPESITPDGIPAKNLCLIPFRVALAAQADGWWVRSVIIWSKPNPMPESVTDRPTESHEYIIMLTKSASYYWDQDAVREPHLPQSLERSRYPTNDMGKGDDSMALLTKGKATTMVELNPAGRNLRSVWDFPTQPYKEAHFATFPEALPERCIKAATPEVGSCARCGAPWVRVVEPTERYAKYLGKGFHDHESDDKLGRMQNRGVNRQNEMLSEGITGREVNTVGWRPSCKCGTDEKVPAVVLDCFAGSGTTLWVAKKLGRRSVGYELSEEYCRLIVERNRQDALL